MSKPRELQGHFAKAVSDPFGGVTVNLEGADGDNFKEKLELSMVDWREQGVRGLWMRIPADLAAHIPTCLERGYAFHHANPGYVMMNQWLPKDQPNGLPMYPHHQIGCAGMVLNSLGQVLVIREAKGMTAKLPDFWKLPGGLVDHKEDISQACVREVLEETGIRTEFVVSH